MLLLLRPWRPNETRIVGSQRGRMVLHTNQGRPSMKISATDLEFLHWYNDGGHGWLGVPMRILLESGVASDISASSYLDGEMTVAYLEEDVDALKFLVAIEMPFEDSADIAETTYDGQCFVRQLFSYEAALVATTDRIRSAKGGPKS